MQRQKVKLTNPKQGATGIGAETRRVPRQAQRQGSHTKDTRDPNAPLLSPCSLLGPDGKERPGWEMRVGDVLFGRADSKESLLQYYARLREPMPSGHWRERSWQPRQRITRRVRQKYDDEYEENLERGSTPAGGWD